MLIDYLLFSLIEKKGDCSLDYSMINIISQELLLLLLYENHLGLFVTILLNFKNFKLLYLKIFNLLSLLFF